MRKPIPPNTLDQLLVPNRRYRYFENWPAHPFRADASGFEPVNAWWLAEASFLAYADADFVGATIEAAGLRAAGFDVRVFAAGGTQCFVLHGEAFAVVAFRGTQVDEFWASVVDIATDVKFILVPDGAGGRVHKGFLQGLALVWDGLREHLRQLQEAGGPGRGFWFTGHSLGAALATLASERAIRELGSDVRGLYTFGSPRVGDESFRSRLTVHGLEQHTFRVVNNSDVIARVPPEVLYRHVGHLKLIDGAGVLHHPGDESPIPFRVRLTGRVRQLFSSAPFFASSLGRFRIPVPKPLADHAPVYYPVHLWNSFNP
ncbi:MAG: lipase family protein [Acidobacteriota bacterium]|nr:lipase family protein [Acidobacteriota bacterium]